MNHDQTFQALDDQEVQAIDGGVAPIYTPDGQVITCTDPRRWGGYHFPIPLPFPIIKL